METVYQTKENINEGRSIKIEPSRKPTRTTKPHKLNYFEIVCFSKVSEKHSLENKPCESNPATVLKKDQNFTPSYIKEIDFQMNLTGSSHIFKYYKAPVGVIPFRFQNLLKNHHK